MNFFSVRLGRWDSWTIWFVFNINVTTTSFNKSWQTGAISDDSYFSEAIPVACGEPGYTGENCTAPICFGVAPRDTTICSGHGNCTAPNVCFCPEGYIGEQCEISRCFGKWTNESTACNGGNCTAKDQCVCKNGYSGPECQLFNCFGISHSDSTACSAVGLKKILFSISSFAKIFKKNFS